MDAKKLGSFIAGQRKALGMTQAELGEKLHVTDKAISRWERGQGLPDINTIEPLADALELSISEVMRAEKGSEDISIQKASDGIKNAIDLVEQKQAEKRKILYVSGIAAVLVFCILLVDHMGILGFLFVALPCFALAAGIFMVIVAMIRRKRGLSAKLTFSMGVLLILFPILIGIFFAMAGFSGLGPVPN